MEEFTFLHCGVEDLTFLYCGGGLDGCIVVEDLTLASMFSSGALFG